MANRSRRRLNVLSQDYFPAYVVWELTLRCDHACAHCGSRAGAPRAEELNTAQALKVVQELADLDTREVVLIGGEAYLHEGFLNIVRALTEAGIRVGMTTGGRGVDSALAEAMKDAGLKQVSVSIDGLEERHDGMRAQSGSYQRALSALAVCQQAGLSISANTNLNRYNQGDLEALSEVLLEAGVKLWQLQLTAPLGRAADRTEMVLQPYDLLTLVPRIATLKSLAYARGMTLLPGNNLGYFGPEEALLRSSTLEGQDHWQGCQAGRFVMGIESQGAIKGCPSLQPEYVAGHALSEGVKTLWQDSTDLGFRRAASTDSLWGFCSECAFASTCLGGCTFTAHSILGRPGNNPYCHYRARALARQGLRERLVSTQAAPGTPFDHGRFRLVREPLDAPEPSPPPANRPRQLLTITRKPTGDLERL